MDNLYNHLTQKKEIKHQNQFQNELIQNTNEAKLVREMELVLFENHDLRQRLSLCQQELITWRKQANEQGEYNPNIIQDLQRQLQEARKEINRLKSDIERVEREKKELWEWCEPRMNGRGLIARAKGFITRLCRFCKKVTTEVKSDAGAKESQRPEHGKSYEKNDSKQIGLFRKWEQQR